MSEKKDIKISAAKGRPMLTWVGKRPLRHVTAFPAQHVETFAPCASVGADPCVCPDKGAHAGAPLQENIWKDWPAAYPKGGLLFHGDNKEVLAHLLANGFRGKVKLIYIDPPFDSGADYVRKVQLRGVAGTVKIDGENYTLGEQIQYTDIWANDNYLQFMYERLMLLKELLAEDGSIYLHCDTTKGHHLRCLMDEIFTAEMFRNEIIWFYENKLGTGGDTFDSRHDSLLVYSKSKKWTHNDILVDVKERKMQPVTQKINGERIWLRDDEGKRLYAESSSHRPIGDVWTIPIINPVASERSGYPTQKPEELLEYVITASSNLGDLVLDCFIGSGTTAAVAQKLGRRWIGCDINKGAIQTTAKRLQTIIDDQLKARQAAPLPLPGMETESDSPAPAQFSFTTWRVNDYDLKIQRNEAIKLACEHIGVERIPSDSFFDGRLGKKLVKIVPFEHPLSPLDLEEVKRELEARPELENTIVMVCLGIELSARTWIDDWNRHRERKKGEHKEKIEINKIEVIELRTDARYGNFFKHEPATAKVTIRRDGDRIAVTIDDFISPTILKRLDMDMPIFKAKITDWRSQVDCVMIDPAYNGEVFSVALSDVPEKKNDLVKGVYELPAPSGATTVAVKIIDMLGEEVLVTAGV